MSLIAYSRRFLTPILSALAPLLFAVGVVIVSERGLLKEEALRESSSESNGESSSTESASTAPKSTGPCGMGDDIEIV